MGPSGTTGRERAGGASLSRDTSVSRRSLESYTARLSAEWGVWGGLNGGYVAATALRAAQDATGDDRPARAFSVQFLAPAAPGPASIDIHEARRGRSTTNISVRVTQKERLILTGQVTFGAIDAGPSHDPPALNDVAPPESCPVFAVDDPPPFSRRLEYRFAGGTRPFADGDDARYLLWLRLDDEASLDGAVASTFLVDASPPALFAVLSGPLPIPTTDLMIHYATPNGPVDDWVLGEFTARHARDGFVIEQASIRHRAGGLMAVATQTRRVVQRAA